MKVFLVKNGSDAEMTALSLELDGTISSNGLTGHGGDILFDSITQVFGALLVMRLQISLKGFVKPDDVKTRLPVNYAGFQHFLSEGWTLIL